MRALRFALTLAWRDARRSRRDLLLLAACVAAGAASVVALDAFVAGIGSGLREQARELAGADLVAGSASPFSAAAREEVQRLLVEAAGTRSARLVRFGAMARVPDRDGARLVQVSGLEAGWPFYGEVVTDPPGRWPPGQGALVDPALLDHLGVRVGDTIALGEARFRIDGTVSGLPGDVAVRAALGPRVYLSFSAVESTRLLAAGARARHEVAFRLPPDFEPGLVADRHRAALARERVTLRTLEQDRRSLERSLSGLSRFLRLVALLAPVLVARRLDSVAVLRCLGASAWEVTLAVAMLALCTGLLGGVAGAALGVVAARALPLALGDFLPLRVAPQASPGVVLGGIGVAVATALVFALAPVLAVRRVPPLAVLRRSLEAPGRDSAAVAAALLGAALVGGVFVLRAGEPRLGLGSAAVAALALLALGLVARLGALLARALSRLPGPYTLRQGLANLHRPQSPTLAVVVTLGFGAFLLATLVVVQANLLVQLRVPGGVRANLALFDVQPDQLAPVQALLREAGARAAPAVPIVPMRLSSVKGEPVEAAFEAGGEPEPRDAPGRAGWVRRREYRSTFRDGATDGERLVSGTAWPAGSWRDRLASEEEPAPVSVEVELARELGVTVGDSLVWDVQGVPVPTRVASLREVSWARFEPNFFVVFPEGPLAAAPHSSVVLAQLDDAAARARLQRRVLEAHPNVGVLDLAQVQQTLDALLDRAASAVRFLALFSLAAGAAVLVGAVAATQTARRREGALLRALGATRGQALQVFAVEYAALGLLAGLAGAGLACGAGALAVRFVVEGQGLALPFGQLLGVAGGLAGLALVTGLLASAGALGRPPLEALREE